MRWNAKGVFGHVPENLKAVPLVTVAGQPKISRQQGFPPYIEAEVLCNYGFLDKATNTGARPNEERARLETGQDSKEANLGLVMGAQKLTLTALIKQEECQHSVSQGYTYRLDALERGPPALPPARQSWRQGMERDGFQEGRPPDCPSLRPSRLFHCAFSGSLASHFTDINLTCAIISST